MGFDGAARGLPWRCQRDKSASDPPSELPLVQGLEFEVLGIRMSFARGPWDPAGAGWLGFQILLTRQRLSNLSSKPQDALSLNGLFRILVPRGQGSTSTCHGPRGLGLLLLLVRPDLGVILAFAAKASSHQQAMALLSAMISPEAKLRRWNHCFHLKSRPSLSPV